MSVVKLVLLCATACAAWAGIAVYLAFYGLWLSSAATQGDATEFSRWATSELESKNSGNSAFVLLENGQVVTSHFNGAQERIDQHTLFPTASFSKWLTALSVMTLVEGNQLDLDVPVSEYLQRWQLPASEFSNDEVTVRRLLSHTAGLTDGLGFGDYEATETLPAVEDELQNPRASSGMDVKIRVGIKPGEEFRYSGGGYLVLQLIVEEVSGVSFVDYVQNVILDPLGMSRSTYTYLGSMENAASSYNRDGSIAPSFKYASPAATGFASSAADLVKLTKAVLSGGNGIALRSETLASMRSPYGFLFGSGIWGLGTILYVQAPNGDYLFGHDGANDPAINATVRINPETSDAIVLLVSGHPSLASNIGSEWVLWQTGHPDFLQTQRALRSSILPILAGSLLLILLLVVWSRRTV